MGAQPAPCARNQTYILISAAAEHTDMGFITAPFRIFFLFLYAMNNDRLFLSLLTLFDVK